MTRKEKMEFKHQTLAIMLHAHNDVLHEFEWVTPGVRREHPDYAELNRYKDRRFNKAATQISNLANMFEFKDAIAHKLEQEVLKELESLEANSDCIDDSCGLDAGLLVDNLLRRIRELKASTTQSKK